MSLQTAEGSLSKKSVSSRPKRLRLRPGLWIAVALVFAAQMVIVFWFGNPPGTAPSPSAAAPRIQLAGKSWTELLALEDPTLFALPHRNGFSGAVWMKNPPQPFEPALPPEPAKLLEVPTNALGAVFTTFMETNPPPPFHTDMGLEFAHPRVPGAAPMKPVSVPSVVRVEGDLARRRLLTPVQLAAQTNSDSDVLQNTVVQVLVDALGNCFSPVVTDSSKNSIADSNAVQFAKNARFEPIKEAAPGTVLPDTVTFGKLIFQWQTVPAAPTNSPSATR